MSDEMAAHWWEGDAGTVGNPPRYSHSVQHSFPLFRNVFLLRVLFWSSHGKWDEGRRNEWKYVIMESEDREGCSSSWDLGAFRQKVRTRWESISSDSHWNANLSSLSCPILHVPHIALIIPWSKWGRTNPWVLQHVSQLVFVTGEFQPQEKSFKSQSIIGSWFKTKLPNYNSLSPPMLIV